MTQRVNVAGMDLGLPPVRSVASLHCIVTLMAALCMGTDAHAEYVRAKPGNGAAEAEAYCNMVARSSRGGFFAAGNPNFVAGAALGYGIGSIIQQAQAKKDCMRMQGYEWKGKPKTAGGNVSRSKSDRQKP